MSVESSHTAVQEQYTCDDPRTRLLLTYTQNKYRNWKCFKYWQQSGNEQFQSGPFSVDIGSEHNSLVHGSSQVCCSWTAVWLLSTDIETHRVSRKSKIYESRKWFYDFPKLETLSYILLF